MLVFVGRWCWEVSKAVGCGWRDQQCWKSSTRVVQKGNWTCTSWLQLHSDWGMLWFILLKKCKSAITLTIFKYFHRIICLKKYCLDIFYILSKALCVTNLYKMRNNVEMILMKHISTSWCKLCHLAIYLHRCTWQY